MPIINNAPNRVVISETANASYIIAGNNTVSNVALAGQVLTGAAISDLYWSTNGSIEVKRGANTVATLYGSGFWNLQGIVMNQDSTANVSVTITSGGSVVMKLTKR